MNIDINNLFRFDGEINFVLCKLTYNQTNENTLQM